MSSAIVQTDKYARLNI